MKKLMPKLKLNQVIALESGAKANHTETITQAYHLLQKAPLMAGISRVYTPISDEDSEKLPPESTLVQTKVPSVIDGVAGTLSRFLDICATRDWGNATAKADIVVNGKVLVKDAPTPFLLFLEKKLVDLHTFVKKLPTLDPAERWEWDTNTGTYATNPTETMRNKKTIRNHVKAEATDKHPAQVEVYHEDVPVGRWRTIKFSGAIPPTAVQEMVARVEALQDAVKIARENANGTEVDDIKVGQALSEFIFKSE